MAHTPQELTCVSKKYPESCQKLCKEYPNLQRSQGRELGCIIQHHGSWLSPKPQTYRDTNIYAQIKACMYIEMRICLNISLCIYTVRVQTLRAYIDFDPKLSKALNINKLIFFT
jgi:hypothetical protein